MYSQACKCCNSYPCYCNPYGNEPCGEEDCSVVEIEIKTPQQEISDAHASLMYALRTLHARRPTSNPAPYMKAQREAYTRIQALRLLNPGVFPVRFMTPDERLLGAIFG